MQNFEAICCIVNNGQASKTLKIAKAHGIKGGTIFLGKGTIRNKFLEIIDLADVKREVIIMIGKKEVAHEALSAVSDGMSFPKQGHGIGFSFSISNLIGNKHCEYNDIDKTGEAEGTVYSAIFTVVDKGFAEDVVEAANDAGARGATIINARGSGVNETSTLFAMPIEPEKELVLILAKNEITKDITEAIREKFHIDEPGRGITFTIPLNEAYGLYN